jgi:hypothetical protein
MTDADRIKRALARFVRATLSGVDFFALYGAKVITQASDGTLELVPDDARVPGLQGVPIRTGIPGTSVKVAASSRVLLGFENGDPDRPYAGLWDASTLQEIVVTASTKVTVNAPEVDLADASAPVLRVGDSITVTAGLIAPPAGGTVTGTLTLTPLVGTPSKVKA